MLDPRIFRSATRSVTVSYPIPFIFVVSLIFVLLCLSEAAFTDGLLRWVLVGFAALGAGFGFGVTAVTMIRRPELLRSERHALAQNFLEFLTAQDIDDSTRESAEKVILGLSGPDTRKPQPQKRSSSGLQQRREQ